MTEETIDRLTHALQERDVRVAELELKLRDADILADEVAAAVVRNQIATRTPVADALEAYRLPPRTDRSDIIGVLRTRIDELEQTGREYTAATDPILDKAEHLSDELAERTAEADRLRVRSEALEAMLVEIRKRIIGVMTTDRAALLEQCCAIVIANGGQSVQHIVALLRALRTP